MTFGELQARAALYATVGGFVDTESPPDWAALVNRAYRAYVIDTRALWSIAAVQSVAMQSDYALPTSPRMEEVARVWYLQRPLCEIGQAALVDVSPSWPFSPPGAPNYWYRVGPATIGLYPSPSTSGDDISLLGAVEPAPMIQSSDVPVIPEPEQEAIALGAYLLHAKPYARGEESVVIANREHDYKLLVDEARATNLARRLRNIVRDTPGPATRLWSL